MPTQLQLFPDEVARFRARYKDEGLVPGVIAAFQAIIKQHYQASGRKFPFREPEHYADPYKVLVSEIMLQQTQADRVVNKYLAFLKVFPDFKSLAEAPTEAVLKAWIGLGYNRRALALKRIAEEVVSKHGGKLPSSVAELDEFPSIGPNTAASIATFAFNAAVPFIETNIRAVYLHFFFNDDPSITDEALVDIVTRTVDASNPREWYYALMDFGVLLKRSGKDPQKGKAGKQKAAAFKGSTREARGRIIKAVINGQKSLQELAEITGRDLVSTGKIVDQLVREGFLENDTDRYRTK